MNPVVFLASMSCLLLGLFAFPEAGDAQNQPLPRAYYSNGQNRNQWVKYPQGHYGMYFKFKSNKNDARYQHHMAYHFPGKGRYVYFYNPKSKKFWGRCPFNLSRANPYQMLRVDDQAPTMGQIDETRFVRLTLNLRIEQVIPGPAGPQKQFVTMQPSEFGMPPLPGTAHLQDPMPMPPPPPPPEVAGWMPYEPVPLTPIE